jgi:chromosome segregation protein
VGELSELVAVDPGWEAAFSAAVGDAFDGLVVSDRQSATEAVGLLLSDGAVESTAERVRFLDPEGASQGRPVQPASSGIRGLRSHVRGRTAGLDALLDRLLEATDAFEGGWREALQVHLDEPGRVMVTLGGERFGPDQWSVGGQGRSVGALALAEAHVASSAADAEASRVADLAGEARERAKLCAGALASSQQLERAATDEVAQARRELERLEERQQARASELASLEEHLRQAEDRLEDDHQAVTALEATIPSLVEAAEADARRRHEQLLADQARTQVLSLSRAALDERTQAVAALRRDLEVRAAGIEERRRMLDDRCLDLEYRLVQLSKVSEQREARRQAASETIVIIKRLDELVRVLEDEAAPLHSRLAAAAAAAEERWRQAGARLSALRGSRAQLEARLADIRRQLSQSRVALAQAELRLETAMEALPADDAETRVDDQPVRADIAEAQVVYDQPVPADAAERIVVLEQELARLGPVNPLAASELSELTGRAEELDSQLEDVRNSRSELRRVVRAIDEEISERFQAALTDAAESFSRLFEILFPGGKGRLRVVAVDDDPMGGVEIEARPAGARVRMLSLLSGGERSLAALAFSFALFQARPSPFYVLDEVEAALDDVNLRRFLLLAEELRAEAQLIFVTHQRRTMEMADCLYGVTMHPNGGSRVVGERIGARSLAM